MNDQIKKLVKSTLMNSLTKLFENPTVKDNLDIDDNLSGTVLYNNKKDLSNILFNQWLLVYLITYYSLFENNN